MVELLKMRRLYIIAGLSATALVLVATLVMARTPAPVYGGKTVEQWLNAGQEDACFALHEIGPVALPYVMAKLAREDPIDGTSQKYRRLWAGAPSVVREFLPKPSASNFDQTRACMALLELGPKTIPDLARYLDSKNPAVRSASAEALGLWRERGKSIEVAGTSLRKAIIDPDARVSMMAAHALGKAAGTVP